MADGVRGRAPCRPARPRPATPSRSRPWCRVAQDEGTLEGMTDDPVGTAASNNPVLTTLTQAVDGRQPRRHAQLGAGAHGVRPDRLRLRRRSTRPRSTPRWPTRSGLLTTVLGFHVVPGEELDAAALAGETSVTTLTGEELSISVDGDTVTVGDQAEVVVPDIQTANATVHLIDAVMVPPSAADG